jgi:hypothetical protein
LINSLKSLFVGKSIKTDEQTSSLDGYALDG